MDKLTVTYETDGINPYARGFSCVFEVDDEAHIEEIHRICKKICYLLGYGEQSIKEWFDAPEITLSENGLTIGRSHD